MTVRFNITILVTGGRNFGVGNTREVEALWEVLDRLQREGNIVVVRHGGCSGADSVADAWAKAHDVPVDVMPADWAKFGRAAGPMRNSDMVSKTVVTDGRRVCVVAYPGGRGTEDCRAKATSGGLEIVKVRVEQ